MRTVGEGKGKTAYSYSGNQIPHNTSVLANNKSTTRRAASGAPASYMKNLGDANSMAQVYGQPAFSNIPGMSGASMMGSGAAMSPYQTLGGAQMSMQPQYSIQMPQGAMALPPGAAMPGVQMYPATTPGLSGLAGSTLTPAQLAAIMKSSNAAPQPQMTSWPQYGGMPGVSYPTMSSYPARNNASELLPFQGSGIPLEDQPLGSSQNVWGSKM